MSWTYLKVSTSWMTRSYNVIIVFADTLWKLSPLKLLIRLCTSVHYVLLIDTLSTGIVILISTLKKNVKKKKLSWLSNLKSDNFIFILPNLVGLSLNKFETLWDICKVHSNSKYNTMNLDVLPLKEALPNVIVSC